MQSRTLKFHIGKLLAAVALMILAFTTTSTAQTTNSVEVHWDYRIGRIDGFDGPAVEFATWDDGNDPFQRKNYQTGTVVPITAVANDQNTFLRWEGATNTTNPQIFITVASNTVLRAVFQAATNVVTHYNITLNANGDGTVAANPTGNYTNGQQVTLTATPNQGATFTGWTGDVTATSQNPLTITMTGNRNITGNFTGITTNTPGADTNSFSIYWQNAQGQLAKWRAGIGGIGSADLLPTPAPGGGWQVAATGDTDTDLMHELLWVHPSGYLAVWEVNADNSFNPSNSFLLNTPLVGAPWRPVAYRNFDGDTDADILWVNDNTGQLGVWFLENGTNLASSTILTNFAMPGSDWRVVKVEHIDDDGKLDILWQQRSTGRLAVWYLDGLALKSAPVLLDTIPAGTGWTAADIHDLNGDGNKDLVWRNNANGQVAIWLLHPGLQLNTFDATRAFLLPGGFVPGPSWRITGVSAR